MNLDKLPYELLENIVFFLDIKSLLKLTFTNKYLNKLDNEYIWKNKCKTEYLFTNITKKNTIVNWKYIYMKLYNHNCIHCYKKTKNFNDFFNVKICRKCEKNNIKYHMITYTKATKEYFLSKKDLSKINYINRNNPFNSSQQLKLFLKTDILNYIKNHYGYYHYNDLRKSKISEKARKGIESLNKFNILTTVLMNNYNMDISEVLDILHYINKYSNNLYNRYIRYNNTDIVPQLIKKCIELNFILKYTTLDSTDFNDFDELLLFFLIINQNPIPLNINPYIDDCIYNCMTLNKDRFKRKNDILLMIYENTNNFNISEYLEIPIIYGYIYYGYNFIQNLKLNTTFSNNNSLDNYTLYDYLNDNDNLLYNIKKIIILDDFLYKYTDIDNIILNNIFNGITTNKYTLYKQMLNIWYSKNISNRHLLPNILYEFLYISI